MGDHYFFYNNTTEACNEIKIAGYNADYIARFNQLSEAKQKDAFREVVRANKWPADDIVLAQPEDERHPTLMFHEGQVSVVNVDEAEEADGTSSGSSSGDEDDDKEKNHRRDSKPNGDSKRNR